MVSACSVVAPALELSLCAHFCLEDAEQIVARRLSSRFHRVHLLDVPILPACVPLEALVDEATESGHRILTCLDFFFCEFSDILAELYLRTGLIREELSLARCLEGADEVGADEDNGAVVLLTTDGAAHALLNNTRDPASDELAALTPVFEVSIEEFFCEWLGVDDEDAAHAVGKVYAVVIVRDDNRFGIRSIAKILKRLGNRVLINHIGLRTYPSPRIACPPGTSTTIPNWRDGVSFAKVATIASRES